MAHQAWEKQLADARWSVVCWPEEYHGRGASLVEWVIFEEEYYRAGAPGPGQPERHLPALPDDLRARHPGAAGPLAAARWRPARRSGPRPGPSPRPGPTSPRCARRAVRDDDRGGWVLNGQKTWSSRAAYAHWGFGLFRSDPDAAAAPRPHLLPASRSTPTASPCGRSPSSTASRASPSSSSTTSSSPTPTCSASPATGWRGRDEHRRQRARTVAALPRPVLRDRRPPRRALARAGLRPRRSATGWSTRGSGAEAYRLYTWGTVSRLVDGGQIGYAGSVNKVFWSELDVALHETALDLLGPEGELRVALGRRLPVLALRADLRRHQRGAAQRRRRADPRPAPGGEAPDGLPAHPRADRLRAVARPS